MRLLNLVGQRFGKLEVIKRAEGGRSAWICRCDCGKESVVLTGNLRRKHTTSCGCYQRFILDSKRDRSPRHFNLSGKKFGRWTALSYTSTSIEEAAWICRCDCGTERRVLAKSLRSGQSRSCGCLNRDIYKKELGLSAETTLYRSYKSRSAKARGLTWEISREEFSKIIKLPCYYCGHLPSNIWKAQSGNGDCVYNGLDRKDNTLGYILSNVVPCCYVCNRAKKDIPYQQFSEYLDSLTRFRASHL
jgi:hypothetical protein